MEPGPDIRAFSYGTILNAYNNPKIDVTLTLLQKSIAYLLYVFCCRSCK